MSNQPRRRGPMGGGHGRMGTGEKAKDFKGTMKKLFTYLSEYKIGIFFVMIFAIGSTVFNIVGPKILGKATTEIFRFSSASSLLFFNVSFRITGT